MLINLRKAEEIFRQFNQERRQYFEDAKDENARLNLRLLKKINIFLIPFLFFSFIITPLIITGWRISVPYFLFIPVICGFSLFSVFYAKKPDISVHVVSTACVIFVVVTAFLVMIIDVYMARDVPANFMPLIFIMVPAIFVFRFRILVPLLAGTEIVYVMALLHFKTPRMAESDIFSSVIGLFFGYLMALTIVQLRIKDNNAKREYMRRSMVDPVTGILNKFSFENSVREVLKAREQHSQSALLILDVDNLKRMNDGFGAKTVDSFLENIADFLIHTFRGSDIIGRVGGDEFMVYVRSMEDEEWLTNQCFRVQQEAREMSNRYGNINMTISIGAVIIGDEPVHFDEIYQMADDTIYQAKTHGRGKYVMQHFGRERDEQIR